MAFVLNCDSSVHVRASFVLAAAIHVGDTDEFLAPGFQLAQPLQPFGE